MISARASAALPLAEVLPEAHRIGFRPTTFSRCTHVASQIKPGDVFVALVEADQDGHDQVAMAVQQGAGAVVAERYVTVPVPLYLVEDTREAYGRMCQALVGQPSRHMLTVGVTGGSGKTSVVLLLASILRAAGLTVGWASSLGWYDGRRRYHTAADYGKPHDIARRLARMEANGCQAVVVECPHRALAEQQWAGVQFDAQIVTDLRRSSTQRSFPPDLAQKVFDRFVGQLKPHHLVALNADDPQSLRVVENFSGQVITTGLHVAADVWGKVVERDATEQTFLLTFGSDTAAVRTPVVGDWWVRNCLLAAAAALGLEVPLTSVAKGIEQLGTLPARLERLACGQPFHVFVDQPTTHDQLAEMLRTLREVTAGRVICVFAPHEAVPQPQRSSWGRVVEQLADYGILAPGSLSSQAARHLCDDVMDGYRRPARLHFIPNQHVAIRYAFNLAQPGDSVLVAAKDRSCRTPESRHPGLDSHLVRQLLYAREADTEPTVHPTADDGPVILKFPRR